MLALSYGIGMIDVVMEPFKEIFPAAFVLGVVRDASVVDYWEQASGTNV